MTGFALVLVAALGGPPAAAPPPETTCASLGGRDLSDAVLNAPKARAKVEPRLPAAPLLRLVPARNPVHPGEPVKLFVLLTNSGATPLTLMFDAQGAADSIFNGLATAVFDARHVRVDTAGDGGLLAAMSPPHTHRAAVRLEPGQSLCGWGQWDATTWDRAIHPNVPKPIGPGRYMVQVKTPLWMKPPRHGTTAAQGVIEVR